MKDKILNFLKKQKKPISPTKIAKELEVSYPTVLKYCEVLKAEGKIKIEDYGNVKLVEINEKN